MGSNCLEKNDTEQLFELVEELSTSGEAKLNEKSLKSLKRICKKSDANIKLVYRIILAQMEKEHSEIRFSCFQILDELFSRSHLFRQLVFEDFQQTMELCLETSDEKKLPPPLSSAKKLKLFALSRIDSWNEKYGKHYKKLELAFDYLKNVKRVDFAGMRSRTSLQRNREEELERRRREIEQRSLETVRKEMEDMCTEIESSVLQGNNCLNLILPRPCDLYGTEDEKQGNSFLHASNSYDDSGTQEGLAETLDNRTNTCSYHGISGKSYNLTIAIPLGKTMINETGDNADLLKSLQDIVNETENRFLPHINKWINILTKCNNGSNQIQRCIYLKNKLKDLLDKHKELEIIHKNQDAESDNFGINDSDNDEEFLDVPESKTFIAENEEGILATSQEEEDKSWTADKSVSRSSKNRSDLPVSSEKEAKAKELLKKAPVIPFDNDLRYWSSKKLHITPITKNDSLHKFWCNGEHNEEFVPAGLEESLRSRAMIFAGTFEKVKWKCRAPMPNGRLCERQDRVKCPFHGKIIPRNDVGEPTNPEDQTIEAEKKRKREEEEAVEIRKDVAMATGTNLGTRPKQRKGKTSESKLRYARLTDVKKIDNTCRKRLEKKVLSAGALRRVEEATSTFTKKRNLEKFGSNFNYHYE